MAELLSREIRYLQHPPHQQQQHLNHLGHGGSGQRLIEEYIVTQQIGSGSFAVVWKGHHNQYPAREVAIKEIATEKLNKKLQESLRSEIAILRKTDHPNIIRLHDIVEVCLGHGSGFISSFCLAQCNQVWGRVGKP